jgi:hypothetical protein
LNQLSTVAHWRMCLHAAVCPTSAIWDGQQCTCPSGKYWTGEACCPFSSSWNATLGSCVCRRNHVWDGNACACAAGTVWNGNGCCPPFALWDGAQCVCPAGKYYTGTGCCVFDSVWVGSVTTGNCKYVALMPIKPARLFLFCLPHPHPLLTREIRYLFLKYVSRAHCSTL